MSLDRRTLLGRLATVLYALMAAVVGFPAIRYLLAPLTRTRSTARFIRVAPLSAIPVDAPLRMPVVASRRDSFLVNPAAPLGQVWLLRQDDRNGSETSRPVVRCLQAVCPHLGCGVDFDRALGEFSCPCHGAAFERTGVRRAGPAPRDMDELECRVTEPDGEGLVWVEVKYQEFETGTTRKRALT